MDHLIDLTDDTLQADDTIQSIWSTLPEDPATIQSRPVEVVISCLAISKAEEWWSAGLLRSRLFRAFTCVNTTHWGIKIGESYYDLKRGRGFFGRPHFQPVRSLEERDERQIVQWIPIGATHFDDEDLDRIGLYHFRHPQTGYDLMLHAPFYHAWFDNCQGFAVNDFAKSILCPSCDSQGRLRDFLKDFWTPESKALASIKELRLLEYIFMLGFMSMELATVLANFDLLTPRIASFWFQILFGIEMAVMTFYIVTLHHDDTRTWERRLQRQSVEQVRRTSDSADNKAQRQLLCSNVVNNAGEPMTGRVSATSSSLSYPGTDQLRHRRGAAAALCSQISTPLESQNQPSSTGVSNAPIAVPIVWLACILYCLFWAGMPCYFSLSMPAMQMAATHFKLTSRPLVLTWISLTNKDKSRPARSQGPCTLCSATYASQIKYAALCKNLRRTTSPAKEEQKHDQERLHEYFCLFRYATGAIFCWVANNLTRPHRVFVIAMHTLVLNTFAPVTPKSVEYRRQTLFFLAFCMAMFVW